MILKYLQLQPGSPLPDIFSLSPFRAIVVIESSVVKEWQWEVSTWLVKSGCLFMMAWGEGCSSWDDSVDEANIEEFNFEKIPEEKFIMTTWHDNEPLNEVFFFSKNNAYHPKVKIKNTIILHISKEDKEYEFFTEYANA